MIAPQLRPERAWFFGRSVQLVLWIAIAAASSVLPRWRPGVSGASGRGVIVAADGLVVTNTTAYIAIERG